MGYRLHWVYWSMSVFCVETLPCIVILLSCVNGVDCRVTTLTYLESRLEEFEYFSSLPSSHWECKHALNLPDQLEVESIPVTRSVRGLSCFAVSQALGMCSMLLSVWIHKRVRFLFSLVCLVQHSNRFSWTRLGFSVKLMIRFSHGFHLPALLLHAICLSVLF